MFKVLVYNAILKAVVIKSFETYFLEFLENKKWDIESEENIKVDDWKYELKLDNINKT